MFTTLALNAIVAGVLLGGIYVIASIGLSITFGLLDIPNVAHPTFIIIAAYCVYYANLLGIDPIVTGILLIPIFYFIGVVLYWIYEICFEARGKASTLQSFTFFFGIALVLEAALILVAGVDMVSVQAPYIGKSMTIGAVLLPYRLVIPSALAIVAGILIWLYLTKTRAGLAIRAVAHDANAMRIIGLSPRKAKRTAFGIAMATAALAGAALIIVEPVTPFGGSQYVGRTFAIVVVAGLGSIPGTFVSAILIGLLESLVTAYVGGTWAPGVAFAVLLVTLAFRPSGIFGAAR